MKRLVVNADDFGLSEGANRAIAQLLESGGITSTTLMANGPAFTNAVAEIYSIGLPRRVGLHVNLTQFEPCGDGAGLESILDAEGQFLGRKALIAAWLGRRLEVAALTREVDAQLKVLRAAGIEPVHLDSHQHAHAVPLVAAAVHSVADLHGLPVRSLRSLPPGRGWRRRLRTRILTGLAHANERSVSKGQVLDAPLLSIFATDGLPSVGAYRSLVEGCKAEAAELMVHPAIVDDLHRDATRISEVSQRDFEVLSSREWLDYLKTAPFAPSTYADLV